MATAFPIGVDESTAKLPNSKKIQEKFGVIKYKQDGKGISTM